MCLFTICMLEVIILSVKIIGMLSEIGPNHKAPDDTELDQSSLKKKLFSLIGS